MMMVKKEIAEIKKTLRPESNSFTMLCGCYVHGEDRERTTFKTAFQSLQEEDFFKYLDVFKDIVRFHWEDLIQCPLIQGAAGAAGITV